MVGSGEIESAPEKSVFLSSLLLLLGLAVLVVALDQFTKATVTDKLKNGRVVDVLGGLVRLDFTSNTGAAFGMLPSAGLFFTLVAVGVAIAIGASYRRIAASPPPVRIGIGSILGGAIGNLIDRVRLGYVVDFIDLRWWPVFNLADSAIVLGVTLIVLWTIRRPDERRLTR